MRMEAGERTLEVGGQKLEAALSSYPTSDLRPQTSSLLRPLASNLLGLNPPTSHIKRRVLRQAQDRDLMGSDMANESNRDLRHEHSDE